MASIELKDRILVLTDGDEVSYVDLSVIKGDKGCRGAQGRAGVILDAEGNIITEGFATEDYVDSALEGFEIDTTGLATEAYVGMVLEEKADVEHVHEQYLTEHQSLEGYATEEYVDTAVSEVEVDLTGYATESYVRTKITEAQIEGAEVDLSDYVKKTEAVGEKGAGTGSEIFNGYDLNIAEGSYAHAEGFNTKALANHTHAEGYRTEASNSNAHAEGMGSKAKGSCSHAEGSYTEASGDYSHSEGSSSIASGVCSHAEGYETEASGRWSHSEGYTTIAASDYQHVQGKYNIEDQSNKYAHIVGNGEHKNARSNAHTLDWNGNAWFAGKVYVGGTSMDDAIELGTNVDLSNYYTKEETETAINNALSAIGIAEEGRY